MAGYELPVTRMDQLGVGSTDYLGRSLAGPGDSHSMSSRSLAGGPGPSLSSPSSLSSSMILSTGKSSRPVSPPMIQVLIFQHCSNSVNRQQSTLHSTGDDELFATSQNRPSWFHILTLSSHILILAPTDPQALIIWEFHILTPPSLTPQSLTISYPHITASQLIPSQYYILTPHFLKIWYPHTIFPHNILSSQPESEYGVKYFTEQTQSVPSEASLTKSNLFSLFIGLAIRVLILFYYAQAFYCSGLKRVLSCHVLASLFPRTKSRYINLFVYDYTIIVWDHWRGPGYALCQRPQQAAEDARTEQRRDCPDETKVGEEANFETFSMTCWILLDLLMICKRVCSSAVI